MRKSAPVTQPIVGPFLMCCWTRGSTLPIPTSFPPSPIPVVPTRPSVAWARPISSSRGAIIGCTALTPSDFVCVGWGGVGPGGGGGERRRAVMSFMLMV